MAVLTQLDSAIYKPGDLIVQRNTKLHDLFIIREGTCNLNGMFQSGPNEMKVIRIVRLPEGSWYGDHSILLDLESPFELRAGKPIDQKSSYKKRKTTKMFI